MINAVSGATGFLGAHVVCQLLQSGNQVRAFKRKSSNLSEFNQIFKSYFSEIESKNALSLLTWVDADVLEILSLESALAGASTIYHCAAMVSFFQKDHASMIEVNVTGTANMVNAALHCGVKQFCHVSSIAALGRAAAENHLDEKSTWENGKHNSQYAISKYQAEMEVWRGQEEGLTVFVVNPGVILGVGDFHKGSLTIIEAAAKGMPFYTEGVNGYVDVADVAACMLQLVRHNISGQRFVLVAQNLSNRELLFQLSELFGVKAPTIRVTKLLAELAWMAYAIKRLFIPRGLPLTKEIARSSLIKSYYSNTQIKNALQFEFRPIQETLANCVAAYLKIHKPIIHEKN